MPEQQPIIGHLAPYLRLLREHPAFGELPEQALKTLVVRSDLFAFAAGEQMLRQGDDSGFALLITQGEVQVVVETAQGEVALGRLPAGALVGEVGVFADLPRTAGVRAHSKVEALKIGRDDVLDIGGADPAFLRAVIRQLGERMAEFNQALGFYCDALARLERHDFDPRTLEVQAQPLPEFANLAHGVRRMAERIGLRRPGQ